MKKFEFTIKGNKYNVHLKEFEDNNAQIEVNGTVYTVEVHQEIKKTKTPKLVRKVVATLPGEGQIKQKASGMKVEAPLPGNIFKLLVNVGDQISKGETLLIMEAMKMENDIKAEKDGIIKAIKCNVGDTVLQGDILIEME